MAPDPDVSHPLRVALVGAGNVGTAVAALLKARGHIATGVWSRSAASAARAAARLEASAARSPAAAVDGADLVLVGVVDRAITEMAEQFVSSLSSTAIVVHFAGAMGTGPLAPIEVAGARPAALHPVQSIPDPETGVGRLPGSAWGMTCAPELRGWARDLVENEFAGVPVDVAEDDRALWHAAAVMTSNGIAAVMSTGAALLARIGVEDPHAVLGPLAEGTVANVRSLGRGGNAFTGPVVRGDRETVRRHLADLGTRFPELRDEYRSIGRAIVAGASRTGRIDDGAARAMNAVLETA